MKTVGVLGGLGPAATVDFMARVLAHTDAPREQDHLRLLVDCNPHVPDRNAAAAGQGEGPGDTLAAMARGLAASGAELLVMPCNSAHAFADDIRAAVNVPFLSMIDAVVAETQTRVPGAMRIALLAADACLHAGLYQDAFGEAGIEVALPDAADQARFMDLLYRIKRGDLGAEVRETMRALAARLGQGTDALVAGCTEVPLVLGQGDTALPFLDCSDVLAVATVQAAGAKLRT